MRVKVRWTSGSVRFRITPGELAAILRGEPVREELRMPGGAWIAVIASGAAEGGISLSGGELRVALSESDRDVLALPESEGVYLRTGGENPIRYMVEKDFPCIHPRASDAAEEPTEAFAPPAGFAERRRAGEEGSK